MGCARNLIVLRSVKNLHYNMDIVLRVVLCFQERGELSPVLRRVELPIVDRSTCAQLYKGEGEITSRMICAGSVRGGADSCQVITYSTHIYI